MKRNERRQMHAQKRKKKQAQARKATQTTMRIEKQRIAALPPDLRQLPWEREDLES